jgi:hypothetical protein
MTIMRGRRSCFPVFPVADFEGGDPSLTLARRRRSGSHAKNDVHDAFDFPNYSGHSGKFMLKLIAAWIAMGFRRPEITLGKTVRRAQ